MGLDPVAAGVAFLVVEDVVDGVVCERLVAALGMVASLHYTYTYCEKFRPVWSSRLEGSARRRRRILYLITRACSYNALLLRSIRSRDFDFDSRTAS